MEREFADINKYREELVGQTVESVEFAPNADEGLVVTFENKASLCFRFSGLGGDIFIIPGSVTIAEQFARQFDDLLFNAIIGKLENKSRKIVYPEE